MTGTTLDSYIETARVRPLSTGYNSHGVWSTLGKIREEELERDNSFPDTDLPDDTPAIWVTYEPHLALRYVLAVSEWERITSGELSGEEKQMLEDITEIPFKLGDIILTEDGDGGYLLIRPKLKCDEQKV